MTTFTLICLAIAFLCFIVAAFSGNVVSATNDGRRFGINLVAFGLAAWVLVDLVTAIRAS